MAKKTDPDDIGTATRVLAEAVSALTRSVTHSLAERGQDVNAQVAGSLRAASRDLSDASVRIGRSTGGRGRTRADGTRAKLLAAARTLFAERGYEGASLGDISAEAGFTKGAVYANFSSKEDVLLAVAADLTAQDARWLDAQADRPADALAEFADTDEPRESRLLAIEIMLYAARHPDVREEFADLLSPMDAVARLVAASHDGDPTSPTPDDLDTALAIIAVRLQAPLIGPADGTQAPGSAQRLVARLLAGSAGSQSDREK